MQNNPSGTALMIPRRLITLLGPTAVGKTSLAARLAHSIEGEVISADSRQVFRGMDIGTGKDKSDYRVEGTLVPSHLVDIADAGAEYSVFSFLSDFGKAYHQILAADKVPVLCGGTGLYLDAVLRGYDLVEVPENAAFRESLKDRSDQQLLDMLSLKKTLHNSTDSLDRSRMIRALEIQLFKSEHPQQEKIDFSGTLVFGLRFERALIRKRITERLLLRLEHGMVEEVSNLIEKGVSVDMLKNYGLEYRFITRFLMKEIPYPKMVELLNTAIHQFAKRQMTWFRRMEKNGVRIHWLEGEKGQEKNLIEMLSVIGKS